MLSIMKSREGVSADLVIIICLILQETRVQEHCVPTFDSCRSVSIRDILYRPWIVHSRCTCAVEHTAMGPIAVS